MITESVGAVLKFDADRFLQNPKTSVHFFIIDGEGRPLNMEYTSEGIARLSDDRLMGLKIATDSFKAVVDNVITEKNAQRERLAEQIQGFTGAPARAVMMPLEIGPTGETIHLNNRSEEENNR